VPNLRGPDRTRIIGGLLRLSSAGGTGCPGPPSPLLSSQPKGVSLLHHERRQPGPRRGNGCWPVEQQGAVPRQLSEGRLKTSRSVRALPVAASLKPCRSELEMLLQESHSLRRGASAGFEVPACRSSPWRRAPGFSSCLMPPRHRLIVNLGALDRDLEAARSPFDRGIDAIWEWVLPPLLPRSKPAAWEAHPRGGSLLLVGSTTWCGLAHPRTCRMFLYDVQAVSDISARWYGLAHAKVWQDLCRRWPSWQRGCGCDPFYPGKCAWRFLVRPQACWCIRERHAPFAPIVTSASIHFGAAPASCAGPSGIPCRIIPLISMGSHDTLIVLDVCLTQEVQRITMPWVWPWPVGIGIPKWFPILPRLPCGRSLFGLCQYPPAATNSHPCLRRPTCSGEPATPPAVIAPMWSLLSARGAGNAKLELDRLARGGFKMNGGTACKSQAVCHSEVVFKLSIYRAGVEGQQKKWVEILRMLR